MGKQSNRAYKSTIDVAAQFATEKACLDYLEALRWPNGVVCLECGGDRIGKYVAKGREKRDVETGTLTGERSPDRHIYQCLEKACKHQFTAETGTIFNDSHLPLQKWMMGVALMINARKGLSAKQLQRDLNVNYRTAWYLSHRIRRAMELGNFTDEKMTGTVEMDETYVGGKFDKCRKRALWDKEPVFGIIERGTDEKPSQVRASHMATVNRFNLYGKITETVDLEARLVIADESRLYDNLGNSVNHEIVNHTAKQYVNGEVHTNGIEGFWSLFKRGVISQFHQISIKHLQRYLHEFQFRFNNRENEDMFAIVVLLLLMGTAMPYEKLTSGPLAKRTRNSSSARKAAKDQTPTPDPSGDEPF